MPKIYETLATEIVATRLEFTVSSAIAQVAVSAPGPSGLQFRNSTGNQFFELGDNIVLEGVTISIPYGFAQGTGPCIAGIQWRDTNSILYPIPELAQDSSLSMPSICGMLMIAGGLFIKTPVVGPPSRVLLLLNSFVLNVSQLNVPALINAAVLNLRVILQITHTLPMSPVP